MHAKFSARNLSLRVLTGVLRACECTVAFALPLPMIGITVTGGWLDAFALGTVCAVLFYGGMVGCKAWLGIPPHSCPMDPRDKRMLFLQPFVNALLQLVVAWALSFVVFSAWWLVFPGAAILVAVPLAFSLAEKVVRAVFRR